MDGITIPTTRDKSAQETRTVSVSFAKVLDSGVALSGTPTVAGTPSGLTLSNVQKNASAITVDGASVAINNAVQFTCAGGYIGQTYTLTVTVATSAGETIVRRLRLRVVE